MSKKRSKEPKDVGPQPRPWVFLEYAVSPPERQQDVSAAGDDIPAAIADDTLYRFEFELCNDICPKTVENFRQLVAGPVTVGDKKNPRTVRFEGTPVIRVTSEIIQGGDVTQSADNKGQLSIYNGLFDDEVLGALPHAYGTLAMANSGPNTNGSQFYICTSEVPAPHLDARHVCFGTMLGGEEAVARLQQFHAALLIASGGGEEGETHGFLPPAVAKLSACGISMRPTSSATSPSPDLPSK